MYQFENLHLNEVDIPHKISWLISYNTFMKWVARGWTPEPLCFDKIIYTQCMNRDDWKGILAR